MADESTSGAIPGDDASDRSSAGPTVVGIGASAGGLAALRTFFAHVPPDSGLAYVVVVHLNPEHESHMADVLQPHIGIPVEQVNEAVPLEPDRAYVIPPGANLTSVDTHLRPSRLEAGRRQRTPIDHFFRTLAETHDGHSIGVILTGTGSDGALGIKAIKERGGFTVVQDPADAEYSGMPEAAIATGLVDEVLPLAEIADAVLRFARTRPHIAVPAEGEDVETEQRQQLQKIFAQLQALTGRDFTHYKRSTLVRRIQRRMQIRQVEELPAYLELLRADAAEVHALADDLLITVTNFFRDTATWQQLEQEIIPSLFEGKGPQDSVRVWSVGCATGEEAYSLAMLLIEQASRREDAPLIQVFASDLHERSLERAREGFYPGDIETDVTPERLRRFFQKEDAGYRVRKEVRERVVFAPHNLLRDPPFSRLDLISCRNVMIYIRREVQREIIQLFHYALRPDGVLVVGTSETVEGSELFRTESKTNCIFRKRNVRATEPRLPVFSGSFARGTAGRHRAEAAVPAPLAYGGLHQKLVEQYGPPSMLVNPDGRVVHLSEHAGRYLVMPGGEPTMSAFRLVREELRIELRAALQVALEERRAVRSRPIPVRFDGDVGRVVLDVRPALQPQERGFALVMFDERAEEAVGTEGEGAGATQREAELQAELEHTRKRLQAIIEDYETGQEEMKASTEELQSANEELRSTLEELETSKEELQSSNEELQTVNQENRHKVEELAQLSGDLQNLMASTEIATLFLDRDLKILRFTRNVGELFNVRAVDRGRPLTDLRNRLGYPELEIDAHQVLRSLVPLEREVQDEAGHWYLSRVLPYRTGEDRIEGVVVTLVDITARRRSEEALRASEERNRLIVEGTRDYAVLATDARGRIETWSAGAEAVFGWSAPEALGQDVAMTFTPEDRAQGAPEEERAAALREGSARDVRWHQRRDGARIFIEGTIQALEDGAGGVRGFLKIGQDMTQRRQVDEALRRTQERLDTALRTGRMAAWEWDPVTDRLVASGSMSAVFGLQAGEPFDSGDMILELIHPEDREVRAAAVRAARQHGEGWHLEFRVLRPRDGEVAWLEERTLAGRDPRDGHLTFTGVVWDITERKRAEEALRASEQRLKMVLDIEAVGVLFFDADGVLIDCNGAFLAMTGYTREDVNARRLSRGSMTPPAWVAPSREQLDRLERTGRMGPCEMEYLRADGTPSWMLFVGAALPDGLIVEYCIDVSDRRRAEAALRESERRFRAVVNLVPDLLWQNEPGGAAVWYNDRWYAYTGATPEQSLGEGWFSLIHPEDLERTRMEYQRALASGEPYRYETRVRAADGSYGWFLVRGERVLGDDGSALWLGAATDIHDQRMAREELEAGVHERTDQLARINDDLAAEIAQRERAEEGRRLVLRQLVTAEEDERRRLSRELHDQMGQQITGLLLGLRAARQLAGPAPVAERLQELEALTVGVSREMQHLALQIRPPALDNLGLRAALESHLEEWGERHGIACDFHARGVDGEHLAPEVENTLYRAVQEGLTNVLKHAGATHVSLILERRDDTTSVILEDNGAGFDAEALQASPDRARRLGLRGMRERVALLGGEVEVESSPGAGTTLFVHIREGSGESGAEEAGT